MSAAFIEGFEPAEGFTPATEAECEVCDKPIVYSGRGRPPKFCAEHKGTKKTATSRPASGGAIRSSGSVEAALANLDMFYGLLATFTLGAQLPNAASHLAENIEKTQEMNRKALEADPKLCAMISRTGQKTGRIMFVASQAQMLIPFVMLAQMDMRERSAMRDAQREFDAAASQGAPAQSQPAQPAAPRPAPQAAAQPPQASPQPQPRPSNPLLDEVRSVRDAKN